MSEHCRDCKQNRRQQYIYFTDESFHDHIPENMHNFDDTLTDVKIVRERSMTNKSGYKLAPFFKPDFIVILQSLDFTGVARGGIEPPTRGFSVLCSTD